MIHEHVPKLQRGLDASWLGWHRREPFQKGGRVAALCQSTDDDAVGICCDNMTENRRHVVEQVYDNTEVIGFGGSGEDIKCVVQVRSREQAAGVIRGPDAANITKGSAQRPVGEVEFSGWVEGRSAAVPDVLA
jgi:hypothetical protein